MHSDIKKIKIFSLNNTALTYWSHNFARLSNLHIVGNITSVYCSARRSNSRIHLIRKIIQQFKIISTLHTSPWNPRLFFLIYSTKEITYKKFLNSKRERETPNIDQYQDVERKCWRPFVMGKVTWGKVTNKWTKKKKKMPCTASRIYSNLPIRPSNPKFNLPDENQLA